MHPVRLEQVAPADVRVAAEGAVIALLPIRSRRRTQWPAVRLRLPSLQAAIPQIPLSFRAASSLCPPQRRLASSLLLLPYRAAIRAFLR